MALGSRGRGFVFRSGRVVPMRGESSIGSMSSSGDLKERMARTLDRMLGPSQVNHLVRFEPVLALTRQHRAGHVLDVGSGSAGLAQLLGSAWRTTALDVEFVGEAGNQPNESRILGDVRRLPIPDEAFDVVIAVDLLEHLHRDDRRQAVRELCRVARGHAIIACPTGSAALEVDRRLADRLESRGRSCPTWLVEHLDRGMPEQEAVVAEAREFGRVQTWGNESISNHERLIRAELNPFTVVPARVLSLALTFGLRSRPAWARRLTTGVLRRLRGMDRSPTYRTIVSVTKRDEEVTP